MKKNEFFFEKDLVVKSVHDSPRKVLELQIKFREFDCLNWYLLLFLCNMKLISFSCYMRIISFLWCLLSCYLARNWRNSARCIYIQVSLPCKGDYGSEQQLPFVRSPRLNSLAGGGRRHHLDRNLHKVKVHLISKWYLSVDIYG